MNKLTWRVLLVFFLFAIVVGEAFANLIACHLCGDPCRDHPRPLGIIVTFDPNGGTMEMKPEELRGCMWRIVIEIPMFWDLVTSRKLPVPKRHGYVFEGWYTKPRGGAPISWAGIKKDNTKLYQHLTLYAHWRVNERCKSMQNSGCDQDAVDARCERRDRADDFPPAPRRGGNGIIRMKHD